MKRFFRKKIIKASKVWRKTDNSQNSINGRNQLSKKGQLRLYLLKKKKGKERKKKNGSICLKANNG